MKQFINIKLDNSADDTSISSFELELLEGADDLNTIVNSQGYVPVKGDMIYLLPGVNIPRVKLKDLALSLGIRVVRDPAKANIIFAGRNSIAKITSSRWTYKVNSTYALERIKELCNDDFYIQNLETAIASTGETDIFGDYNDIYNILAKGSRNDYTSSYIYTIDPDYSEMYNTVKDKIIYSEAELLNNINGDDSTTIDEEVFQQLKSMFDSSDTDNHVLAMEIMANSKYEDSVLYLLMLISENAYKINNSNTRNHVNFKSMLSYFNWQPRDVNHINTDDIVQIIDKKKGLLTVDMIKRLYQEYSDDIIRNIHYDEVFEVKEVTIKQEYLDKLNITSINLINPAEVSVVARPDPIEIEEEVLEDELIEAAFTNIERKELKSELIALEEEEELAEKDLATYKQEESNNHQTTTNDTDIDWF
jgi:hypothetical protein